MRNFANDLKRGQQGELNFLGMFLGLKGTDGRRGDIMCPDGSKIELKTDFYSTDRTKNFFIERYSSVEVLSPGGPWQADAHGCEWFVYYYTPNKCGYVFNTKQLLEQLSKLEKSLVPVEVKNRNWTTIGYKVSRHLLKPVATFTAKGFDVLSPEFKDKFEAWGFVSPLHTLQK